MNFNKNNLGIDLNNFGDSLTEIERRNKSIVSALCKVKSKTLRELLTKVGLTTVGTKQDLRLRLCRYFSQKLETEDKDPNFSGTYFTSKATQDQIESIIAEQSATPEDSEDEILDSEVKGLTEDLENKLAILNNTGDSSANSLATNSANTNIISNDTNLTIPIDQGTSSVIPTISPDNINKLFNATNTALSIVNTLIDNTSKQTKPTSATQNQTKNHILTTEPIKMTPKIHISKFEGKSEEDLQEFLNLFNRFSKLNNWSNENKADYINFYLQGAALVSLQNFLALGDKTWQEIVDHLSCRFGQNKTLDYSVQLQYLKLEPQLMSLETYIHTVEKLSTALNMSEEMKVIHLIKGLPVSMIDKMDVLDNSTFQKAIENIKKIQVGKKIQDARIRSSVLDNTLTKVQPDNQEVKDLSKQIENLSIQIQAIQKEQTKPQGPHGYQNGNPPRNGFYNPRGYNNYTGRGHYNNYQNRNYQHNNNTTSYRPNHYQHNNTRYTHHNNGTYHQNPNNTGYQPSGGYHRRNENTPFHSGSSLTIVNKDKIDMNILKPRPDLVLTSAGKSTLIVLGETTIHFTINTYHFSHNAIVVQNLSQDIILGTDFLKKHKVCIDYNTERITAMVNNTPTILMTFGDDHSELKTNTVVSFPTDYVRPKVEIIRPTKAVSVQSVGTQTCPPYISHSTQTVANADTSIKKRKIVPTKNTLPLSNKINSFKQSNTTNTSIPMDNTPEMSKVSSAIDITIPPKTLEKVPVHTDKTMSGIFEVDLSFNAKYGLFTPISEFTSSADQKLEVFNTTNSPITIHAGTTIGHVYSKQFFLCNNITFFTKDLQPTNRPEFTVSHITDSSKSPPIDLGQREIDINPDLPLDQYLQAKQLINEYIDIFAKDAMDLEEADLLEYRISLTDDEPVTSPPYKLSPKEQEEMDRQIDQLLKADVLQNSTSNYSSPAFLIPKPDNSSRLVVDYRKLNKKIVGDQFPQPKIQSLFDCLEGSKYYCSMDVNSAFYQQPIAPADRKYTA
ncbi:hypothetical protein WDU94_011033 [Cyamophila willieti]